MSYPQRTSRPITGSNLTRALFRRFEGLKWLLRLGWGMQDQGRSTRKRTGGRRRPNSGRRKHQLGRLPTETELGEVRLRAVDARGNTTKVRALATDVAQVATGDGDTVEATIEDVVENDANPNYVRRNIVTKGAVVETSEGRARVTSRPGQTGQVNAVLLE